MPWRVRLHLYIVSVMEGRAGGPAAWLLRCVLACGVPIYWVGLWLSRSITRPQRISCPIISVGNLTVGGTGKTPVVAWLAERLQQQGRRVAILTRGYHRALGATGLVDTDGVEAPAACYGDEPVLLARRLPRISVLVGDDRVANARGALQHRGVNLLLLDDGFQHWALARDLDVVLLDGARPFGNGALLPLGTLREPDAALRRAHLLLVHQPDGTAEVSTALRQRLQQLQIAAPVVPFRYRAVDVHEPLTGQTHPTDMLRGARVRLLSSIAQPDRFEDLARQLGAQVVTHVRYPDHHPYAAADWRRFNDGHHEPWLTTEKDWMRLEPLARASAGSAPVWVLRIDVALVNPDDEILIDNRLAGLLRP